MIWKNRVKIVGVFEQNRLSIKQFQNPEGSDVVEVLLKWFKQEKWQCTNGQACSHDNFCSS
jgi:hypothetical protein